MTPTRRRVRPAISMVSPGCNVSIRSLRHAVDTVTPAIRTPTPKWAIAYPQVPRGRWRSRRQAVPRGCFATPLLSARSVNTPSIAQAASAIPANAAGGAVRSKAKTITGASSAPITAGARRRRAARRLPRRQASTGPITIAMMPGARIGTKVASKNCGPTDSLTPLHTSANSG